MLGGRDGRHRSADAAQHVDRRIVIATGQFAREHDVPVENAAHGVRDRLVVVVAFDENAVERGDAALAADAAGPLEQAREETEDGWRIPFGGWRFAGGQADFALRHRETRDRVHHQQHVAARVAEALGNRRRRIRRAQARERGAVGRGNDHHRFGQAFGAEVVFEKAAHFAAAFADERKDDHVGLSAPCDHAEQRALADAAAAEHADALAAAAGQHRVDRAHAGAQRTLDRVAVHRIDRRRLKRNFVGDFERSPSPTPIERAAPDAMRRSPGQMPAMSASGTDSSRPSRNPTTSMGIDPPSPSRTSQISPTLACGPSLSTTRPTTRVTWPASGAGLAAAMRFR